MKKKYFVNIITICFLLVLSNVNVLRAQSSISATTEFLQARRNGMDNCEALNRCLANTKAWFSHVDPETFLIPDNFRTPVR